jgi:hypothetical protein
MTSFLQKTLTGAFDCAADSTARGFNARQMSPVPAGSHLADPSRSLRNIEKSLETLRKSRNCPA